MIFHALLKFKKIKYDFKHFTIDPVIVNTKLLCHMFKYCNTKVNTINPYAHINAICVFVYVYLFGFCFEFPQPKLYRSIIEDVIESVREIFADEGVEEQVLKDLQKASSLN